MGSARLRKPVDGLTLFAIPKELWKLVGLTSSSDQVDGSPAADVQLTFTTEPLCQPVGVWIVKAEAKGRRTARVLRVANILEDWKSKGDVFDEGGVV